MALAGDWAKVERYARLGALGGYQNKSGKPVEYKQGMPKLTPTQQEEVLLRYTLKERVVDIARLYGVSAGYVSKLASRRGLIMRQEPTARANKSAAARRRCDATSRIRRLRALLEESGQ